MFRVVTAEQSLRRLVAALEGDILSQTEGRDVPHELLWSVQIAELHDSAQFFFCDPGVEPVQRSVQHLAWIVEHVTSGDVDPLFLPVRGQ